jgi:acyl-CoA synthetase (AMP-forming)/AMP-acid ligase II
MPHLSPYGSPSSAVTVSAILLSAARDCPDRRAVVSPDGSALTYRQLIDRGLRRASALLAMGLGPGDRVALWMGDTAEHVEVYVAAALAGLVVVPINARFTDHEGRRILEDSDPRVLFYSDGTRERAETLLVDASGISGISVGPSMPGTHRFDDLLDGRSSELPAPAADDLFVIGYTSGTTGPPKGAMLTQGSVATLARMNALSYRLPVGSVAAMTGSMSFVAVVPAHVITHFYVRGTVRLLGAWDVESVLDVVETERATFTYVPSPLVEDFARSAEADLQRWISLTTVLHSASKVTPQKLRRLADAIGGRLLEGLGMTENSGGLVTATTPADVLLTGSGRDLLATVGRPVPEVSVRVVDAARRPLPHDGRSVGELVFSSPALMAGYWRRPDATAAAVVDGWYHSGDLGTIDAEGYVEISDRRADLIVSGGMNVYPFEVEQCILSLSGVADCAVVGLPHDRWGQCVVAAVVRRPDAAGELLDEAAVVEHCRTYLASYKKPTRVVFLAELPRTPSLKVFRPRLRAMLGGQ